MFSYQEFLQTVKSDGLARQNRFFINIAMPALTGESAIDFQSAGLKNRNLHILCKSVNIPGVNVAATPQRDYGETFEAPYDRTFADAQFTFYVDRGMYVRKFFDDWINTIQNPDTRELGYYNSYVSKVINVFVMDKMSRITYMVQLYDAHPKTIGALSLDQASNDVMTMDVSMAFHYYKTIIIDQPDPEVSGKNPYSEEILSPSGFANNDFFGTQNAFEEVSGAFTNVGSPYDFRVQNF